MTNGHCPSKLHNHPARQGFIIPIRLTWKQTEAPTIKGLVSQRPQVNTKLRQQEPAYPWP